MVRGPGRRHRSDRWRGGLRFPTVGFRLVDLDRTTLRGAGCTLGDGVQGSSFFSFLLLGRVYE